MSELQINQWDKTDQPFIVKQEPVLYSEREGILQIMDTNHYDEHNRMISNT
jgi:hypothetical protein